MITFQGSETGVDTPGFLGVNPPKKTGKKPTPNLIVSFLVPLKTKDFIMFKALE